jgi:hypothetical protein
MGYKMINKSIDQDKNFHEIVFNWCAGISIRARVFEYRSRLTVAAARIGRNDLIA